MNILKIQARQADATRRIVAQNHTDSESTNATTQLNNIQYSKLNYSNETSNNPQISFKAYQFSPKELNRIGERVAWIKLNSKEIETLKIGIGKTIQQYKCNDLTHLIQKRTNSLEQTLDTLYTFLRKARKIDNTADMDKLSSAFMAIM